MLRSLPGRPPAALVVLAGSTPLIVPTVAAKSTNAGYTPQNNERNSSAPQCATATSSSSTVRPASAAYDVANDAAYDLWTDSTPTTAGRPDGKNCAGSANQPWNVPG